MGFAALHCCRFMIGKACLHQRGSWMCVLILVTRFRFIRSSIRISDKSSRNSDRMTRMPRHFRSVHNQHFVWHINDDEIVCRASLWTNSTCLPRGSKAIAPPITSNRTAAHRRPQRGGVLDSIRFDCDVMRVIWVQRGARREALRRVIRVDFLRLDHLKHDIVVVLGLAVGVENTTARI
jgi:hypothetical protein